MPASELRSELFRAGIMVLPEPQEAKVARGAFAVGKGASMALPAKATPADRFAAQLLAEEAKERFGVALAVSGRKSPAVTLKRNPRLGLPDQGYTLAVTARGVEIVGKDEAGLYYGAQTLIQLLRRSASGGVEVPCVEVRDWPDIRLRAIHYDTKHHQDKTDYVRWLIRTLAHHKVNMLIWEWEDKLAYESHPEVGAPGAFTKKEMQEFTRFAAQHHVQLVPLVQGLGHASFILKHTKWRGLREVADSSWEFCPLNEGSYDLLFALWDEAIEATPGSRYLHVGCDETRELGRGVACGCKALADEHGSEYLLDLFLTRVQEHLKEKGRTMVSWAGRPDGEHAKVQPRVFTGWRAPGMYTQYAGSKHEVFCYAPNPGIGPLFLPLQPAQQKVRWHPDLDRNHPGSVTTTSRVVATAVRSGEVDGMVCTSWDDSGLHMSMWVPRFLCAAEFAWSGKGATPEEWKVKFARSYFGGEVKDLWRLYRLLQDSAWFYYCSFQRQVWHFGDVGKVHLPDLPRWEDLEYSPYWQSRYADWIKDTRAELRNLEQAFALIHENLAQPLRNKYDFDLYLSIANLMQHNAKLILGLGELEHLVGQARDTHFASRPRALGHLRQAVREARSLVEEREKVYADLVRLWEKSRLPKGLSTAKKAFVHRRDRGPHFANRTADMRYLIVDEDLLDLEGWADALEALANDYEKLLER